MKIIEKFVNEVVLKKENNPDFETLVKECLDGKHNDDPKFSRDGMAEIAKDGKGHLTININELCNIEEIAKDPSKFTNEEIQMLAEALAKLGE